MVSLYPTFEKLLLTDSFFDLNNNLLLHMSKF